MSGDSNNRAFCCPVPADGVCAAIDSFVPTAAKSGDTITLFSTCNLSVVTEVRICGTVAPIVSKTDDRLEVTVPAGVAGACSVQVISPAGTFTAAATLTVS